MSNESKINCAITYTMNMAFLARAQIILHLA